ncbi:hypothetical protein pfor_22c2454 [Rhodobacteraceae bacterium SB2]|nr:hypothetical protein pfor_22c2454 [Rhodobacteraceae bacterium SB2]
MRILFICTREPSEAGKADQITTVKAIEYLRRKGIAVEVLVLSQISKWLLPFCILKGIINLVPFQVELYRSNENKHLIMRALGSQKFDKVYLHLIRSASHINILDNQNIYLGMQVSQYLNYERTSKQLHFGLKKITYLIEAKLCKVYERRIVNQVRKINFVGTFDSKYISYSQVELEKVTSVPHGVDIADAAIDDKSRDLVFLANFSSEPNQIALKHLVEEIMELVWTENSNISLSVAGRNIPSWAYNYTDERIRIIGEVESAHNFIGAHKIFVNPVRASAGMQNKVLTSLIAGTPVVTYSTAVEGMNLENELVFEAADTIDNFARLVTTAISNYPEQNTIMRVANSVAKSWSWETLHDRWAKEFLDLDLQ